ncbi:MAG: PEP-CTERM sorting domain-containing protein, partial [Syntrophaceae bacterium]|nr:PEP-CTERM sorting domain-containing protein [Syntrophaceae bacterium]
ANNGISDILAPIDSLLGVFLGPGQPNFISAPGQLDFSSAASLDYLTLNPQLQQVFFMGDGITSGLLAQTIIAPTGATRLYLGTMDGYGWANNIGAFEITMTAVPEPTTMFLLGLGLMGLVGARRRIQK